MDSFNWRGRSLTCGASSGVVLNSTKRTETNIRSSGGGVTSHHMPVGAGSHSMVTVSHPVITTTNTVKHEFWYRRDDGSEVAVKLSGPDIPLREGQRITLLSVGCPGAKGSFYSTLVNHAAGQHWTITGARALDKATGIGKWRSAADLQDAIIAGVIAVVLFVIATVMLQGQGMTSSAGLITFVICLLLGIWIVAKFRAGARQKLIAAWLEETAQVAHRNALRIADSSPAASARLQAV
jgi:hypothetical protein